jgi:hydrogenase maturation protease
MKTLILGLGNDLLGDDAVGIIAARRLYEIVGGSMDIVECSAAGMALLDVLVGYDRVVIFDAIHSGDHPLGTVFEMSVGDLRPLARMSPHYAGLPEVMLIGQRLGLDLPREIAIFAVEIEDCLTIGGELSEPVALSVEELTAGAIRRIGEWDGAGAVTPAAPLW